MENKLIAYDGYTVIESGYLRDDKVISYEFRNLGTSIAWINGIELKPLDVVLNLNASVWKTDLKDNEINGLRFQVKFEIGKVNKLLVITKRYIN